MHRTHLMGGMLLMCLLQPVSLPQPESTLPCHIWMVADRNQMLDTYQIPAAETSLPIPLESITKSISAMLLGYAWADSADFMLDQQVEEAASCSWSELLSMQLPWDWREDAAPPENPVARLHLSDTPGPFLRQFLANHPASKGFRYATGAYWWPGQAIRARTGQSVSDFSRKALFDPLELRSARWLPYRDGNADTGGGLIMSPDDLLRLGQHMLAVWSDPSHPQHEWLRQCWTAQVRVEGYADAQTYGLGWWIQMVYLPQKGRFERLVMAHGYGDRHLIMVPNRGLCMVWIGPEKQAEPLAYLKQVLRYLDGSPDLGRRDWASGLGMSTGSRL